MQSQCTTRMNPILLTCACQSHAGMQCKYLYTRALFQIWKQHKSLWTFLFQNGYLPLRAESECTWLCFQYRDSRMSSSHVDSSLLWVEPHRKPLHWGGAVIRGGTDKGHKLCESFGFSSFCFKNRTIFFWKFVFPFSEWTRCFCLSMSVQHKSLVWKPSNFWRLCQTNPETGVVCGFAMKVIRNK